VKLFVGRLPSETTQKQLRECFEEFGEVSEVFVIASKAVSGVGCAFVRMAKVDAAEQAIADLHEQRVLIPEKREMGPMQVAFAKGEAIRLGLDEKEEILPSFKEARQKVEEHKEKRMFFEAMSKQQELHEKAMKFHQAMIAQQHLMVEQCQEFSKDALVDLIKDGQRQGGEEFKKKWRFFCEQGWGGKKDYDPNKHAIDILKRFVTVACRDVYGMENWFRSHFEDLSDLPEAPPGMPPPGIASGKGGLPPPGMLPPGFPPLPGMLPPDLAEKGFEKGGEKGKGKDFGKDFGEKGFKGFEKGCGKGPMMGPPPGLLPGLSPPMLPEGSPLPPGMMGMPPGFGMPPLGKGLPGLPFGPPMCGKGPMGMPFGPPGGILRPEQESGRPPKKEERKPIKAEEESSEYEEEEDESGSEAGDLQDINADDI